MCIQKTDQKPAIYELRRAVAFEICGCHLTGAGPQNLEIYEFFNRDP